jgi:HrpA-like RNA helicase
MVDNASIFDDTINSIEINKIQYSIISSGTGTGKTTTLPCKLVKFHRKNINYRKVIVMLPTKEAVKNAYNRVLQNKINNVNVDFTCGYARNSIVSYHNYKTSLISNSVTGYPMPTTENDDTNLVYVTTGHMKRLIREYIKYLSVEDYANPRSLLTFDYIIIDEAHLRNKNMDIDIILGFLKYMIIHFPDKGIPRIICTSATYTENNTQLFNLPDINTFKKNILYIELEGEGYKEKVLVLGNQLYLFLEQVRQQGIIEGIALVFLPGIKEIKTVANQLNNNDIFNTLEVVIAHGSRSEIDMQKDVFTPNSPGKWKIILSTNIAETSLTIPNVFLIVDFGYENIRVVGGNKTIYNKVERISKDSANQRAGRTGRTCDGLILRMMSASEFNNLRETVIPEIQRLPISNEVLLVLECNVDCRFIFGDRNSGVTRSISDEQSIRLKSTLKELAHFKLIRDCNGYYDVTEKGKFVSSLPVGNKAGILIVNALEAGIDIYPVIVLACAIENIEHMFEGFRLPSQYQSTIPFYSILKPWLDLCARYGMINFSEKNINKLITFCRENHLDFDSFHDMQKKIVNCITRIRILDYHVNIFMFDPEDLFLKIRNVLDSMYFPYRIIRESNKVFYKSLNPNIKHKPIYLNDKFLQINGSYPEKVTAIFNMEINGGTNMILWFQHDYKPSGITTIEPEAEVNDEDIIPDINIMDNED